MAESRQDQSLAAVEKVIRIYLDGLYEGDTDKLTAAFHEAATFTRRAPKA
jgi:hypothetical protein